MLGFLKPKAGDPLQVGVAPAEVHREPEVGQVISLRAVPEPAVHKDEPVGSDSVVDSLTAIPDFNAILTGVGGAWLCSIPKQFEFSIMVLETGGKRALLYFDGNSTNPDLLISVRAARNTLVINGYDVVGEDRKCTEDLIRRLVENYKQRSAFQGATTSNSEHKGTFESWISLAWRERASDLHVLPTGNTASVKIRVDGSLEDLPDGHHGLYTESHAEAVVGWAFGQTAKEKSNSAAMFGSNDNIYAMLEPQQVGNTMVGMRFQSLVGAYGPKVVIRLYDVNQAAIPMESLGYADSQIELLVDAGLKEKGIVLFCGETGSGKTLSQKTFIESHPANGVGAIYSLEDPIELPLEGVHQIPFQRDLADQEASIREFNHHVASIVRSDPNGVLIGEIRDQASAGAAMQLQATGHFVVATLHAHKLSGVARRLTEEKSWGLTRAEITSPNVLTLIIYQALVPVLCEKCKISGTQRDQHQHVDVKKRAKQVDPVKEVESTLEILSRNFGLTADRFYFRRAGGCPHCKRRGTTKRTGVAEMFMPDETWLRLTAEGDDLGAHKHYCSLSDGDVNSPDMTGKTILEHTLYKAALGLVDPRECKQFDGFENQFK